MAMKRWRWHAPLAAALAMAGAGTVSAAGFERLTKHSGPVLKACNPGDSASNTVCRVTGLPGESGYQLVASRSAPLVRNETVVGTLYEKVWRHQGDTKLYIFGVRLQLNAEASDSSGLAFNVNDLFRQTLPKKIVSVAYQQATATKALRRAGRTVQGLNEYEGAQPERNNAWVGFRIDANAAEPQGPSSASSPWLLAKTRAPKGVEINDFGVRLLNSQFADPLADAYDLFVAGYRPKGVPPPTDDDDEAQDD